MKFYLNFEGYDKWRMAVGNAEGCKMVEVLIIIQSIVLVVRSGYTTNVVV